MRGALLPCSFACSLLFFSNHHGRRIHTNPNSVLEAFCSTRQPVKEKSDCLLPILFWASSIYPQNNVPGDRRVAELLGKVRAWPTSASASPVSQPRVLQHSQRDTGGNILDVYHKEYCQRSMDYFYQPNRRGAYFQHGAADALFKQFAAGL